MGIKVHGRAQLLRRPNPEPNPFLDEGEKDEEVKPKKRPKPPGKPKGAKNKKTQILDRLLGMKRVGELPHEFLLRVSQGLQIRHGRKLHEPTWEDRMEAAKAAAPFFAPKLSTVEVIRDVSDVNLDEIIRRAAAETGISVSFSRESETGTVTQGTAVLLPAPGGADPSNPYLLTRGREQSVPRSDEELDAGREPGTV
jgi:hypothetical protein